MKEKDQFIEFALAEMSKNGLFSKYLAEAICKNPKNIEMIVSKIDPTTLAKELANQITYLQDTKRKYYTSMHNVYLEILKEARHIAAAKLANESLDGIDDIREMVKTA